MLSPEVEAEDIQMCVGETVTLSVEVSGGIAPYAYNWDNGLGAGETHDVSPAGNTTYTVTVTGGNDCSVTAEVAVTVDPLPVLSQQYRIDDGSWISGNGFTVCPGQDGDLGFEGTDFNGWTFEWTGPNGFSATIDDDATLEFDDLDADDAGTYSVTYIDPLGCSNNASFNIDVNDLTVDLGSNTAICEGDTYTLTATVTGGSADYTYTWDPALPDQASHVVTPDVLTIYRVTVTDANGCTDSDEIRVNVRNRPEATVAHVDPLCEETTGAITFSFDDDPGRTNIEFSLDGGNTYESSVSDQSGSVTYENLIPATYDLWVRWGNNECPVDLPDVTIDENTTTIPDLDEQYRIDEGSWVAGNNLTVCPGQDMELGFAGSDFAGWTFVWTGPNGFSSTVNDDAPPYL